jgi:hypothetical protein
MKSVDRRIEAVKENRGGQPAAAKIFSQYFFPVFQHPGFSGGKIHLQNTVGYGGHGVSFQGLRTVHHREHRAHRDLDDIEKTEQQRMILYF